MPSTFMTYGGGEISSATVRNRQWDFTVKPLSVRYICHDFPYMVFADYTKVMGTPVWGLAWLVVSWIAFDNMDNTTPGVIDNRCWSEKCLHLWQEFIRRAVRGFIRCSLVVLQIMLPGYGIQLVLALSMMLVAQIDSAFTFDRTPYMHVVPTVEVLKSGVWDRVRKVYSSETFSVIALDRHEIAQLTAHAVMAVRIGIDVVLTIGIYNNMGCLCRYLTLARFILLFVLINPAAGMFVHFMDWNFPHMLVVGLNGTGLDVFGLMRILWYNMSWVVRYSLNMVCYLLNLVLWLVSMIGYTIGEFSKIAMDGRSQSDTPEGSVPMT